MTENSEYFPCGNHALQIQLNKVRKKKHVSDFPIRKWHEYNTKSNA